MMSDILYYLVDRLDEKSTWDGIIAVITFIRMHVRKKDVTSSIGFYGIVDGLFSVIWPDKFLN